MNDSMKMLYNEHRLILQAMELVRYAKQFIGKEDQQYKSLMNDLISFFRNYADKYHHYKEEEILFPEMCKKNELLSDGVIMEMLDHHEDFRGMLREAEEQINNNLPEAGQYILERYVELLFEHIAVENDELFQMAESLFNEDELERIQYRFQDCDRDLGLEEKMEWERKLQTWNEKFTHALE